MDRIIFGQSVLYFAEAWKSLSFRLLPTNVGRSLSRFASPGSGPTGSGRSDASGLKPLEQMNRLRVQYTAWTLAGAQEPVARYRYFITSVETMSPPNRRNWRWVLLSLEYGRSLALARGVVLVIGDG